MLFSSKRKQQKSWTVKSLFPFLVFAWVENLSTFLMLFDRYKKLQALLVPLWKQSRILLNDL